MPGVLRGVTVCKGGLGRWRWGVRAASRSRAPRRCARARDLTQLGGSAASWTQGSGSAPGPGTPMTWTRPCRASVGRGAARCCGGGRRTSVLPVAAFRVTRPGGARGAGCGSAQGADFPGAGPRGESRPHPGNRGSSALCAPRLGATARRGFIAWRGRPSLGRGGGLAGLGWGGG